MQLKKKILFFIGLIGVIFIILGTVFITLFGPMTSDSHKVEVVIPSGTTLKEIGIILEEANVIRSKNLFYIYIKLYNINSLEASNYTLNTNMSIKEIIQVLKEGNNYNPNQITLTFKEGINVTDFAKVVSENTNNSYAEVIAKIKDESFLNSLISKYWFLSDDIINSKLYYPLEGYLYPNTYFYDNKDVTVETIIIKMLNALDNVLTPLKEEIKHSDYSLHQIMTLASIVELEGVTDEDRAHIAGVFYNRLNSNMNLGSDVTSYYGVSVSMKERDLTVTEFNNDNPYNTRLVTMAGKLPVGPVSNPGKSAIIATIRPKASDYYYFVADKNKKVYFSKTLTEHEKMVKTIKEKGDWIEW